MRSEVMRERTSRQKDKSVETAKMRIGQDADSSGDARRQRRPSISGPQQRSLSFIINPDGPPVRDALQNANASTRPKPYTHISQRTPPIILRLFWADAARPPLRKSEGANRRRSASEGTLPSNAAPRSRFEPRINRNDDESPK